VLNQIKGRTHDGSQPAPVPTLFGTNFQAVSVGEKLASSGYLDVLGTPSQGLLSELDFVDSSLGQMVSALKDAGIYDETLIIIGAKHGQSPIDKSKKVGIGNGQPATLINTIASGEAFDISDDGSLIWLNDSTQAAEIAQQLSTPANQSTLGIQEIFAGNALKEKFNSPLTDARTPDIILKVNTGVIFTGGSKIAEHGGLNEDDTHVALLFSMPEFKAKHVKTYVLNQQVAPTIIQALGLDPNELKAVRIEGISPLPFLF
jgi:arylsulfatase A-like enzyme